MAMRDIDDLPKNAANYTALTPLWFLERAATVHPDRKSVVHGSVSYTWRQTYQRCRRLASALSRLNIGVGSTGLVDEQFNQIPEETPLSSLPDDRDINSDTILLCVRH